MNPIADPAERKAWLLTFGILATYMACSRLVLFLPYPLYSWQAEGLRTVLRFAAAAAFWWRVRLPTDAMPRSAADVRISNLPVGLLVFLAVPLLVTDNRHGPFTQAVNIAGSIGAGVMEEIVFRGLIQRMFYRHMRPALAILGATALFTAYHIGVVPLHWYAYAQVVPASLVLGTLYASTGSLPLAMAVHALFDILAEFGPVFAFPIPYAAAFALLCLATVLTLGWGWRTLRASSLAELESEED